MRLIGTFPSSPYTWRTPSYHPVRRFDSQKNKPYSLKTWAMTLNLGKLMRGLSEHLKITDAGARVPAASGTTRGFSGKRWLGMI